MSNSYDLPVEMGLSHIPWQAPPDLEPRILAEMYEAITGALQEAKILQLNPPRPISTNVPGLDIPGIDAVFDEGAEGPVCLSGPYEEHRDDLARLVTKARDLLEQAEPFLLRVLPDGRQGKCREALNAASRVNEACGYAFLHHLTPDQTVVLIRKVPPFDLSDLVWAMRSEVCRAAGKNPCDQRFAMVLDFARREMKGGQLRVIEVLCERGGRCPMQDLAAELEWEWDQDEGCKSQWDSTAREINKKLLRLENPYHVRQHDSHAEFVRGARPRKGRRQK
jgi:hypothetical protein